MSGLAPPPRAPATGCKAGLIQQAWTRPFKLSAAFGSMVLACKTRQRNVAWMWPLGTAEPVVEIEMAEGGIEIVTPQQADHPAAEPDAFGIAGRSVEDALGFGEFVDFLRLFGGVLARRRVLVGGLGVVALGQSRGDHRADGRPRRARERRTIRRQR